MHFLCIFSILFMHFATSLNLFYLWHFSCKKGRDVGDYGNKCQREGTKLEPLKQS